MSRTDELIREHAGKLPAREIAEIANVSENWLRTRASDLRVSLAMPIIPTSDRKWMRVPKGEEKLASDLLNAIIQNDPGVNNQSQAMWTALKAYGEQWLNG